MDERLLASMGQDLYSLSTFTLSLWLRPEALDGTPRRVVSKYTLHGDDPPWDLFVHTDNRLWVNPPNSNGMVRTTQTLRPARWHHIVMVYNDTLTGNNRVKLYINGEPEPMVSASATPLPALQGLDGAIDEVRAYRRALAPTEVTALHNYRFGYDFWINGYGNIDPDERGRDDDPDGDGSPNEYEYVAGTGADDSNSTFRFEAIHPSPTGSSSGRVLSWQSTTDRYYAVHVSTNLGTGFSPLIADLPATPPINVYTDNLSEGEAAFYQGRVERD